MKEIVILCVEDEPEVRDALRRDLQHFEEVFQIECAEDSDDAHEILKECEERAQRIGLILCDHVLPGKTGVDFMADLSADARFEDVPKVLVTGQAGHQDTIRAINEANLQHYIAKPWDAEDLKAVVHEQLTDFVIAVGVDVMPYVATLDGARLLESMKTDYTD